MYSSHRVLVLVFFLAGFIFQSPFQANARDGLRDQRPSSIAATPFSIALENLQKQINYEFQKNGLLRRAMTHPSFSEENNRVLSILGADVIQTSASLRILQSNIDISPKQLNRQISQISNVESSCALEATRLGLHKVIRVSSKTNSSSPQVACGAFRAIFGAVAIDSGKSDEAGNVFWGVHSQEFGVAVL